MELNTAVAAKTYLKYSNPFYCFSTNLNVLVTNHPQFYFM